MSASFRPEPKVRAYESDALRQLAHKQLGLFRLIAGKDVPRDLVSANDVVIPYHGAGDLSDYDLLYSTPSSVNCLLFSGAYRMVSSPDSPSRSGVIHRVVQNFALHLPA